MLFPISTVNMKSVVVPISSPVLGSRMLNTQKKNFHTVCGKDLYSGAIVEGACSRQVEMKTFLIKNAE